MCYVEGTVCRTRIGGMTGAASLSNADSRTGDAYVVWGPWVATDYSAA